MTMLLRGFLKDQSGATAIEYGLILALITICVVAGASTIGQKLSAFFTALAAGWK